MFIALLSSGYTFMKLPKWLFYHWSLLAWLLFIKCSRYSRECHIFLPVRVLYIIYRFLWLRVSFLVFLEIFIKTKVSLIKFYLISVSKGVSVVKLGV